jgi:hypothetical protein
LEEASTEEGPDGFLRGVFDDGFVFITEVPNITKGLPTRKALKEEDDMKKKAEREEKKEAKAKAKAEAKKKAMDGATKEEDEAQGKGNAKTEAKAKAKTKAKAQTKAKAKPNMKIKGQQETTPSEVEKKCLPTEGLEPPAQQTAPGLEDPDLYCTCWCQHSQCNGGD